MSGQAELEVHEPFVSDDGTVSAAVTLPGSLDRLTARVPGMTISDADENWTRGFVMSRFADDAYSAVISADVALADELDRWAAEHAQTLPHADFVFAPSDRKAGKVRFVVFRSPENWTEYSPGDDCDVELELRGIQRGASARAYSALWRAVVVSRVEQEDAEESHADAEAQADADAQEKNTESQFDIEEIAKEMRHLAEKLSKGNADRAPMAIPS